jgi:hypothetical protein
MIMLCCELSPKSINIESFLIDVNNPKEQLIVLSSVLPVLELK